MAEDVKITRRGVLGKALKCAGAAALAGAALHLGIRRGASASPAQTVWQLDPEKCVACGKCATACVRKVSPVKCVHAFAICGYCDLCFGYFQPQLDQRDTSAENQLCPAGAIERTFVEDPYYQYTIDQSLCIGCSKCVKGCTAFGNGSLFLQIIHGDMTFKEWLRSQGEEQMAEDEDFYPRRQRDVNNLKSGIERLELGGNASAHRQNYTPTTASEKEADLAIRRIIYNGDKRVKLFAEYKSQLGHVPRCLNCNECSIAVACPAQAFKRVPANQPYLLKKPQGPA